MMKMKTLIRVLLVAACAWGLNAQAATTYNFNFASGFANGQDVPDGNAAGWTDSRSVSMAETVITDVNVRLNITDGYNGDLYVYLVHSSGFSVLLNRMGRTSGDPLGNSGSGFAIWFDDAAGVNAHSYTSDGTYHVDGRTTDPANAVDTDTPNSAVYLDSFNGLDANGTWTLFVADMSGGDDTESHIVSWELEITAVPEPTLLALGVFGGLCATVGGVRYWRRHKRSRRRYYYHS